MADLRFTNNDPNYERIRGIRNARGAEFLANIAIVIGVITAAISESWLPFLVGFAVFVILKLKAAYLYKKYED